MPRADSIACARNDSVKINSIAAAKHNLAMAETDESGGFHNHLYSVALLQDAIKRAASIVTGIRTPGSDTQLPTQFALFQNYPNPFNPSTTIRFAVPVRSRVRLDVYDILGQRIQRLMEGEMDAGYHETVWSPTVSSGIYFLTIEAISVDDPNQKFSEVKRMVLLK